MNDSALRISHLGRNLLAACILTGFGSPIAFGADSAGIRLLAPGKVASLTEDPMHRAQPSSNAGTASFEALSPHAGFAADGSFIVKNCDDSGPGSLRQAMLDASGSAVIELWATPCDRITLTSGALTSSASIMLVGPVAGHLTIDANGTNAVIRHDGAVLNISGLALVNGRDADGTGGCLRSAGDVSIENSLISECVSGEPGALTARGGGIYASGKLSLTASTVTGNVALGEVHVSGGGIWAAGNVYVGGGSIVSGNRVEASGGSAQGGGIFSVGSSSVTGYARIEDNQAISHFGIASGGGIQTESMDVLVMGSVVTGNVAFSGSLWADGGGIAAGSYSGGPADLYLVASTLSGNMAQTACATEFCWSRGGGASALGRIEAKYSTVRDNSAKAPAAADAVAAGGGLATASQGMLGLITLQSSTLSGNSAICGDPSCLGYGGGAAALASQFIATNSTIAFNSATSRGGGLVAANDPEVASGLVSSIVAQNQSPSAPDIDLAPSSSGVLTLLGEHSLVTTSSAAVALPADTLAEDPLLQPLQSNGGATATHALPACSPAVDAGSNTKFLEHDQRGTPYAREAEAGPDIGAFELQADPDRVFHDGFESLPCL